LFRPDLPDKVDTTSVLPLGLADKLVMSVDKPHKLPWTNPNKAATGSYNLRTWICLSSAPLGTGHSSPRPRGNGETVSPRLSCEVGCKWPRYGQLLDQKGRNKWSVRPDATVSDAVAEMANRNVGLLVLMDGAAFVGTVAERHLTCNAADDGLPTVMDVNMLDSDFLLPLAPPMYEKGSAP
jgi:hypothetical protein